MMNALTVGQLTQKAHIHIETVRYYEKLGLMPVPRKNTSGYRQYSEHDVTRLAFIKHAQELGFSLKEIRELLSLRVSSKMSCSDVKKKAEAKIQDIAKKIKTLQRMQQALEKLTRECDGRGPVGECPILEALEQERTPLEKA